MSNVQVNKILSKNSFKKLQGGITYILLMFKILEQEREYVQNIEL